MILTLGETYLVTTDDWFTAPNGEAYKAVFGTFRGINTDAETLGVKTNARATNWYAMIGNMGIAGCQIHYAIKANGFNDAPPSAEVDHEGIRHKAKCTTSRIYNADVDYEVKL